MERLAICLACNLGASTSILVSKMQTIVEASQKLSSKNVMIEAVPAGSIDGKMLETYQVILLGPQIGHRKEEIEEKARPYHVPVAVIDAADYGTMNAANILKEAIYLIKTNSSEG
ncbi:MULTISPECIES: PTS sugar transporter subunit IIB [unclassified Streptococcus]|uniref:PTS sugar transporter subunit IIB n=1 Tax=unclassified Streptococcus TaxID=2608887 RepID=UPI00211B5F7F|nr:MULTISPECIES: PTS sugar transporter subunit IIB [unclassified Streptococcus]MCQ9211772.1 PTS sugar transporter subunit IIB [Streptococcus sp. B01]MCQ9213039.1 PTS sugar transporter subunit IIB [Streptococcus sp. O1]